MNPLSQNPTSIGSSLNPPTPTSPISFSSVATAPICGSLSHTLAKTSSPAMPTSRWSLAPRTSKISKSSSKPTPTSSITHPTKRNEAVYSFGPTTPTHLRPTTGRKAAPYRGPSTSRIHPAKISTNEWPDGMSTASKPTCNSCKTLSPGTTPAPPESFSFISFT